MLTLVGSSPPRSSSEHSVTGAGKVLPPSLPSSLNGGGRLRSQFAHGHCGPSQHVRLLPRRFSQTSFLKTTEKL